MQAILIRLLLIVPS